MLQIQTINFATVAVRSWHAQAMDRFYIELELMTQLHRIIATFFMAAEKWTL